MDAKQWFLPGLPAIRRGRVARGKWITWLALALVALLAASASLGPAPGAARAQAPPGDTAPLERAAPQALTLAGNAITYQGYLTDGGSPANGVYDFAFSLYADAAGTQWVGDAAVVQDQWVVDGLFTVMPDFTVPGYGDIHFYFNGEARYLRIGVRPGASTGAFTYLSPLQPLTPAPYAQALPGLHTIQNGTSPNVVGGYPWNSVGLNVVGATISGGGTETEANAVHGDYGTVGGGGSNRATDPYATVGGGWGNHAGNGNVVMDDAHYATVGGGFENVASNVYATVGGGEWNEATGIFSTVAGGQHNVATGGVAAVCGGTNNEALGNSATVAGGYSNTASGMYAMVPGGNQNTAQGSYSFAAGRQAKAYNTGCFVWGDNSTTSDVNCSNDNRWVARTTGGVYFYTNTALTSGVRVVAGGNSWSAVSDRRLKENVETVDYVALLERLATGVPITTWNYETQDASIRHIGPMAQDLYQAFGLGEDAQHIATVDADGIALAAIQGLYQLAQDQEQQIAEQQTQIAALEARITALEQGAAAQHVPFGAAAVGPTQGVLWLGGLVLAAGLVMLRYRPGRVR
jgi:hypothetical protein